MSQGIITANYLTCRIGQVKAQTPKKAQPVSNTATAGTVQTAYTAAGQSGTKAGGGKEISAVDDYKRRHPEDACHVDAQVRAGKAVRSRNGADQISRDDMTMEEYKEYVTGLLLSIPFDSTRIYDQEIISISDAGWEQMKKDPDYEAWVLGYTVENRSVRNPFFGWGGQTGSVYVESFGASIDEHLGQSVRQSSSESKSGSNASASGKSWWMERHERFEELIEESTRRAQKRLQERRDDVQQELASRHYLRTQQQTTTQSIITAVNAYESTLNLLS